MRLEGLHHVTAITADAQQNVDFYAGLLGLRLVKKTVNFDAPDVYHLYFADEQGSPGSVMTFFEFPGAAQGRAGAGMVHLIEWRVGSDAALEFWEQRLRDAGVETAHTASGLRFADPEGLAHELRAVMVDDAPLRADSPEIPFEHALSGLHGVRAYSAEPAASSALLTEALGFERDPETGDDAWVARGRLRHARLRYNAPGAPPGVQGAGTVHHIAWAVTDDEELVAGMTAARAAGAHTTDVIDRQYFHSVYFREPSGVLFELATEAPGFAIDEPRETLGESLALPPRYESMREQLERTLTPISNPRSADRSGPAAGSA